ncbi:MAG: hypothetical protein A2X49_15445 [Lentisphaerae bacterium GWF2_52_8]|nr:MAG: hypothetical protein A2X49_15445 [Lentisphaerae bacterium GWF2_52_8]
MELNYKVKGSPITELGYVTHKGKGRSYRLKRQTHPIHEIIYVDYGKIILELPGRKLVLRPGYCVFIRGGTLHAFHGIAGEPFDFLNICYKGVFPGILEDLPFPVPSGALEILDRLKQESASKLSYSREISVALLTEFIYLMSRHAGSPGKAQRSPPLNSLHYRSKIVRKAISIVEKDFKNNLSLQSLASATGVSSSHLRALIRKETGRNFSYHLQRTRIDTAKRLLRGSSYSIGEIPEAIGYNSLPFFFKTFKRFTGMTPREYANSLGDPESSSP